MATAYKALQRADAAPPRRACGKGAQWGRPQDEFGLAASSMGFPSYMRRSSTTAASCRFLGQIVEAYYAFPVLAMTAALDYQFIVNPAYNRGRGPVSVIGT